MPEKNVMKFLIVRAIGKDKVLFARSDDVYKAGDDPLKYESLDCLDSQKASDLAYRLERLADDVATTVRDSPPRPAGSQCFARIKTPYDQVLQLTEKECRRLAESLHVAAKEALTFGEE